MDGDGKPLAVAAEKPLPAATAAAEAESKGSQLVSFAKEMATVSPQPLAMVKYIDLLRESS